MAYSKPTLNDILLSFSYRYGETSIPSTGTENRIFWINRGVEFICDRLKLTNTATITVSAGVADLNSTASGQAKDFRSFIKLVDSNGTEIPLVRNAEYASYSGNVCAVSGSFASGYTLNAKTDGTYTLHYVFYPAELVSGTDECIIPDMEAVSAYAYAQIRKSETDPLEDVDKNMGEVLDRIKVMSEDIARNEGDLTFKSLY